MIKWFETVGKSKYHKCLLCPCKIQLSEVYCSSCSWEVWAVRKNAEEWGGKFAEKWEKLQKKIEKAKTKRKL